MLSGDPDWQMTALFLLAITVMTVILKLIALRVTDRSRPKCPRAFWIVPSPLSIRRLQPVKNPARPVLHLLGLCAAVTLGYAVFRILVSTLEVPALLRSYLAAPFLLLLTETALALVRVIWLPSGLLFAPLHNRPWQARSVADFWGQRWNTYYSDWTRSTIFQPLRRRPIFALFLAFIFSGVLHELVINLPLYFVTGRMLFGTIMIYFALQAVGILIERKFKKQRDWTTVWCWLIVFLPCPLIINEGLLRTMHLW
jgi:hypothetical protein